MAIRRYAIRGPRRVTVCLPRARSRLRKLRPSTTSAVDSRTPSGNQEVVVRMRRAPDCRMNPSGSGRTLARFSSAASSIDPSSFTPVIPWCGSEFGTSSAISATRHKSSFGCADEYRSPDEGWSTEARSARETLPRCPRGRDVTGLEGSARCGCAEAVLGRGRLVDRPGIAAIQ